MTHPADRAEEMRDFPRRHRIDQSTSAENEIRVVVQHVEALGCSVHLTRAVNLLNEAREAIADFVDRVPEPSPTPPTGDDAAHEGEKCAGPFVSVFDCPVHDPRRNVSTSDGHYATPAPSSPADDAVREAKEAVVDAAKELRSADVATFGAEIGEAVELCAARDRAEADLMDAVDSLFSLLTAERSAPATGDKIQALTFAMFQAVNVRRCVEAFNHELDGWSLLEWAGALAGEVGEAANVAKKIRRKQQDIGGAYAARDPEIDALKQMLADEIGDCFAYLVLLASAAGLDAAKCAAEKFDAVTKKSGWNGPLLAAERDAGEQGEG